MKNFRSKHASIATARWAAYTAAGVATALAGNQPVEASIHYSGRLDVPFQPNENMAQKFQLDQAVIPFSSNAGAPSLVVITLALSCTDSLSRVSPIESA